MAYSRCLVLQNVVAKALLLREFLIFGYDVKYIYTWLIITGKNLPPQKEVRQISAIFEKRPCLPGELRFTDATNLQTSITFCRWSKVAFLNSFIT